MIEFAQALRPPIRRRLLYLGLCWLGIFLVTMGVDLFVPYTLWGALARLPVNVAVAPAFLWTGFYFIHGPRPARRWWLMYRFVVANWNRVDNLVAFRKRPRPIRRPAIYPFWWTR